MTLNKSKQSKKKIKIQRKWFIKIKELEKIEVFKTAVGVAKIDNKLDELK